MKKKGLLFTATILILGTILSCAQNESKKNNVALDIAKKDTLLKTANTISLIREAHRGYSMYLPENTLLAFEESIKIGTDRIEMDVNITSDGELIIIHDKTLDRTTNGAGLVTETSYAEIQKLDAGSWKSPEFKEVKVPTLKEVFELTKGKCMLNLDLKDEKVAKPMVELAEKMGMIDQIVITGKIPVSVNTIREINNSVTMFYELEIEDVEKDPIGIVRKIREENLPGCLVNYKAINKSFMKECKLHGIAVYTWGVLLEKDMKKLIDLGVEGIMTDDLELLNKVLNK